MSKYSCSECSASNIKLWRESHSIPILKCAKCLGADNIDEDGKVQSKLFNFKTDQIGSYVPAVPYKDDPEAFYAYTAVPDDSVKWWISLPSKSEEFNWSILSLINKHEAITSK